MKVILFGATGMIGQGVLLECLRDPVVEQVLVVGRSPTGARSPKVREVIHRDLENYGGMEATLAGYDACLFCLGTSARGMREADYERITYGFAMAAATALSRVQPGMAFLFVSGAGSDSSERSSAMWARIKGRTENALMHLPLRTYMFRPGFIEPLDGIQPRNRAYRAIYRMLGPAMPLLVRIFPHRILTTREIGQAMLAVARSGYATPILEVRDIRRVVGPRALG